VYLAQDLGEYFDQSYRQIAVDTHDYKFEALSRLHAGAARIGGEIYSLLIAGYGSGAHARWRTLHELSIVAAFIAQEHDEIAERYIHHEFVKTFEDAKHYQEHAGNLGADPLTDEELKNLTRNYRSAMQRYGDEFRLEFGWAIPTIVAKDPKLKGQRIGIKHLQRAIDEAYWTPIYRMASHAIHPTATFARVPLGIPENSTGLLAGPSNRGLSRPAVDALIALSDTTATLAIFVPKWSPELPEETKSDRSLAPLIVSAKAIALRSIAARAVKSFAQIDDRLENITTRPKRVPDSEYLRSWEPVIEKFVQIPLSEEGLQVIKKQLTAFSEKFGRDAGPDDPVFFDPASDVPEFISEEKFTQRWNELFDKVANTGAIRPELAYAAKKTGFIVTESNLGQFSKAALREWNGAVKEYTKLYGSAKQTKERENARSVDAFVSVRTRKRTRTRRGRK
jgi:hypothetical protein